ncbi:MAG: HD domain-containing protein [Armatimonadota bacterium]|nr:HD domain-containing protein [Armatimonadota bacterium]
MIAESPTYQLGTVRTAPPFLKDTVRLSEIVSALSHALDLTEGAPDGHGVRTCILGMKLAQRINLAYELRSPLFYSLLLKDIGCSSNSARMFQIFGGDETRAKREVKTVDWTRPGETLQYICQVTAPGAPVLQRCRQAVGVAARAGRYSTEVVDVRCHRGSHAAMKMGFSADVANGILHLDEHWDGHGKPSGVSGLAIPIIARILCLAQTLEAFLSTGSLPRTEKMLRQRRGRWFQPELCDAAQDLICQPGLLDELRQPGLDRWAMTMEPEPVEIPIDGERLDSIADGFGEVIDAKSPYTHRHSLGVTEAAVGIAQELGFCPEQQAMIRRAALLHDIGKLGVPNAILDKPGKLTAEEWAVVRKHPEHTQSILERSSAFSGFASVAAAHHERLDGSGYPFGLRAGHLSLDARIIAVADVYDALSAERPYRAALPWSEVHSIMSRDCGPKLDAEAFDALSNWVRGVDRG